MFDLNRSEKMEFLDHVYKIDHYLRLARNVKNDGALNLVQKRRLHEEAVKYFNEMKQKFREVANEIGERAAERFMVKLRHLSETIQTSNFFLYPELFSDYLTQNQVNQLLQDLQENKTEYRTTENGNATITI